MPAKLILGIGASLVLAGAYVYNEGAVRVSVDEQKPGGAHIHLFVPAALVSPGLRLVPEEKLREAALRAQPWLPAVRVASAELARLPDCELVEVQDASDHVRIATRSGALVIDVQSSREAVHVSIPLKLARRATDRLEAFAPSL